MAAVVGILLSVGSCGRATKQRAEGVPQLTVEQIESPVPLNAIVPQVLESTKGEMILTWLEPLSPQGYRFRLAVSQGDRWTDPATITSGKDISMFPADLPGVTEAKDGTLTAYWQVTDKSNGDRYATIIQVASSRDGGRTWSTPTKPYHGAHPGQHGFISAFPVDEQVGFVWLDAEEQQYIPAKGGSGKEDWKGAIGLRFASVNAEGRVNSDSFIDRITCECCPTAAAVTARGPVVVYRGRQEPRDAKPLEVDVYKPTVRDIQISRLENSKWTVPHPIFNDNWVMNACPDNGPAVDAAGNRVAVAWWTAANDKPNVKVAFSGDAGDTFSPPVRVDMGTGTGQVTVSWTDDQSGAVVGWLENNRVWARWVSRDGLLGTPVPLGTAAGRRLPRWIARSGEIVAVWTTQDQDKKRSVRVARLRRTF